MKTNIFVCLFLVLGCVAFCFAAAPCGAGGLNNYKTPPGLCAWIYASGVESARGITLDSANRILVEQAQGILSMYDTNQDGVISNNEKVVIGKQGGLNHAVTLNDKFLYASSNDFVYRWRYFPGNVSDMGRADIVIKNVPGGGNHQTRTLAFDPKDGALFVSVGSQDNVDSNSNRARVVRCAFNFNAVPSGGYDWSQCTAWADGTRNEVGLRFDAKGRLWGVENGCDDFGRPDLKSNVDLHNNNPCEEVNLFEKPGFYGYPYCISEYQMPPEVGGGTPGQQWVHPNFINDGVHSDAWCRNPNNVIKPNYCLPAHVAPLDIIWHDSPTFPPGLQSGIFVTEHGSWNRNPPQGYDVVHLDTDANGNASNRTKVLWGNGSNDSWNHRPVALQKISPCGPVKECLLVTDDGTGSVIAVGPN